MKIHELLDNDDKWIQGYFAQTEDGSEAEPGDDNAVAWCLLGAARKCYRDEREFLAVLAAIRVDIATPEDEFYRRIDDEVYIATWNDDGERKYRDILAVVTCLGV
jgi:hypothetical protein